MKDEKSVLKEILINTIRGLAEQFSQEEIESFKAVAKKKATPFYLFIENTLPYGYDFHAVNGDNCKTWLKHRMEKELYKLVGHREESEFLRCVNVRLNLLINAECQELQSAA
jgi:hypothetical protein